MKRWLNSIEAVLADLRKGRMAIVVDDADRENEGDLIMRPADAPRPSRSEFHGAVRAGGLICVPTTSESD